MQVPIGFEEQPDAGACGKSSLQHALLLLGQPITMRAAHQLTRVPRWKHLLRGTNEKEIMRAIRRCGCRALEFSYPSPGRARRKIDALLGKGLPVILSVQNGDHWAVLAGLQCDRYDWIDSADDDLIGNWSWSQIDEWIRDGADDGPSEHYLIGVEPKGRRGSEHSLVPRFRQISRLLLGDADLCKYWGYYLEDLLEVFDCPAEGPSVTAADFFLSHKRRLLKIVSHAYAFSDEKKLGWEIGNYRKVALAHNLTMSPAQDVDAVGRLSAALTVILCEDQ